MHEYELVLLFECRIRSKDIIANIAWITHVKYLYTNGRFVIFALIKLIVARKRNISRVYALTN